MLITDLLNTLFDQSDYATITILRSLHKRKTTYANKYSILIHYDIFDKHVKNIKQISEDGKLKMMKQITTIDTNMDIICISAREGHIEAVKYLMSIGTEYNEDNFFDRGGVLHHCIRRDHFCMVKYLMSVIKLTYLLRPLICLCAEYGRLEMVKYIVSFGDKYVTDFRCDFGRSEIDYGFKTSAINGHLSCVIYFVENGADVNYGNAFMECAKRGHLDVIKYLVSKGVDVNTDWGLPVLFAAISGHLKVVEYLISKGAFVNVTQRFASVGNVFDYCEEFGYHEIAKCLRRGVNGTKN